MMRKRIANWWALQKLSWFALRTDPEIMANSLKLAALEHEGAQPVSDDQLMQLAFQDKLSGKGNSDSVAMKELLRRHGI